MPRTPVQAAAFLVGFWIALWLSPFRAASEPLTWTPPPPYAALESELFHAVNEVRATRHLIPLERHPDLDAVARAHSLDMARRGFLSHDNPDGENPVDRLERAGLDTFTLASENLGITDRPDPNREILHAWLASEVHRRNLHSPVFNATGIGVARAPNGSLLYTQVYVTYPR